ncbi:MAG: hypothetical protein R6U20_01620, partial [Longimonas sp.]|uniref:hypothetical protein n=1 Tax=Longimonas sp. TaxID=2039626 RepID=UPI003976B952
MVDVCIKTNWESLPTKRDPKDYDYGVDDYVFDKEYKWQKISTINSYDPKKHKTNSDIFSLVVNLMGFLGYVVHNDDMFEEAEEMYFQNYDSNDFLIIKIIDKDIYLTD